MSADSVRALTECASTLTREVARELRYTPSREDSLLVQRLLFSNDKQALDLERGTCFVLFS